MTDNLKEREAFESALSKNSDVRFWNTTDAMFWAWSAALAQAQSCVPAAPELCDPSCGTYDLASMILSDCGHSSNNQRLLDRVAARIDKRLSAVVAASPQPQPVQPSEIVEATQANPTNNYLFKLMCDRAGIVLGVDRVDAACKKIDSMFAQAKPEQAAQPLTFSQRSEVFLAAEAAMEKNINLTWRHALVEAVERHHGIAAPKPKD